MIAHSFHPEIDFDIPAGHERTGAQLRASFTRFAEQQEPYAVVWWIGSLMLHGVMIPLTHLFVYMWGGPAAPFLFTSMIIFFLNFVANMGGASMKARFVTLAISILLHAAMVITTLCMLP